MDGRRGDLYPPIRPSPTAKGRSLRRRPMMYGTHWRMRFPPFPYRRSSPRLPWSWDFKSGGKGVAIGKVSESDNTFEVAENWDVKVYGMLLKEYIQQFAKTMYPVGSIYMSVSSTNPSTYFGGTWVAWGSGRVPVGINTSDSNFNTVEKTGGASAVTLTTSQMPSHTHTFTGSSTATNSAGGHTHNIGRDTDGGAGSSAIQCIVQNFWAQATSPTSSAGAAYSLTDSKGKNANTGGGGSHTNLQPYIVCYMWKRTA